MARNLVPLLLLAAFCGCWLAIECKKLSELGLGAKGALSEDEDVDEDDANDAEWKKFKGKYGKKYKDAEEEKKKKTNFKENLKRVAEQNKKFLAKKSSFTMRIHKFSDWSLADIKSRLQGSDKIPDESKIKRKPCEGRNHLKQKFHQNGTGKRSKRDYEPGPALNLTAGGYVTKVKDQAGVLEGNIRWATKDLSIPYKAEDLSAQNLVDCSKNDNQGCSGGWPLNALEWVRKNGGIMKESQYPYNAADSTTCSYKNKTAIKLPIIGTNVLPFGNETELKKALWNHGPIALLINADSPAFNHYKRGVMDYPACSKSVNHAVLLVGYGYDEATGKDFWLVKNSWGTDWGNQGYIQMLRNEGNQCGIASYASYTELA